MSSNSCRMCGRLLTDPASVELGIGPVCAGKGFGRSDVRKLVDSCGAPLFSMRLEYKDLFGREGPWCTFRGFRAGLDIILVATDECDEHQSTSITNGAENVWREADRIFKEMRSSGRVSVDPRAAVIYVEHYRGAPGAREEFDLVMFRGKFESPDWMPATPVIRAAITGVNIGN